MNRFFSRLIHLQEASIITLFGWIPLSPGKTLRRIAYRRILKQLGTATRIETGVIFKNADHIELGREVRIDQDVRIRNMGRNSIIHIGDRVVLARGVDIKVHPVDGGRIEIGERSSLSPYCCLSGKSIIIGKNCLLAHYVGIFANNHVFTDPVLPIRDQGHTYKGVTIEDDCWLGTGVRVLDGVTIGRGSVVGAGAVVTKSLPYYSIAVGVPAKIVSYRGKHSSDRDITRILPTASN